MTDYQVNFEKLNARGLTDKQARKALDALDKEFRTFSHIQARVSDVDGMVTVEAFTNTHQCFTIRMGTRAGIRRTEWNWVE